MFCDIICEVKVRAESTTYYIRPAGAWKFSERFCNVRNLYETFIGCISSDLSDILRLRRGCVTMV